MRSIVLSFFLVLLSPVAALAAEVVASSVVDGRRVELMSDHSWRYAGKQADSCNMIHNRIDFCDADHFWERLPGQGPEISAMFQHGSRDVLMFIAEDLGARDGLTLENMSNIVLDNAADAAGITRVEIPVLKSEATELFGAPARTIVYKVNLDGLDFVFANTIVVLEGLTLQTVTYSLNTRFTDTHAALHKKNLDNVRLSNDG